MTDPVPQWPLSPAGHGRCRCEREGVVRVGFDSYEEAARSCAQDNTTNAAGSGTASPWTPYACPTSALWHRIDLGPTPFSRMMKRAAHPGSDPARRVAAAVFLDGGGRVADLARLVRRGSTVDEAGSVKHLRQILKGFIEAGLVEYMPTGRHSVRVISRSQVLEVVWRGWTLYDAQRRESMRVTL